MKKSGFRAFCTWLACAVSLLAPLATQAVPGDLDLNFGGFGTAGQIQDTGQGASDAALDAQGRLVTSGTAGGAFSVQRRSGARFLTAEDETISFPGQTTSSAQAVAIAPDGKIVLAGNVTLGGNEVFGVARLNTDLSLDTSFDGDGLLTSTHDGTALSLGDVAVQSDGKIVIVGDFLAGPNDREIAVQRFNDDGSPDLSFDGDGKVTFTGEGTEATAVAIQADGRILVAGAIAQQDDFLVIRLNSDGSPDTDFSGDGYLTTDFGEIDEQAADVTVAANGKIVVAGTGLASNRILVARYLPDGEPDGDFDGDGQVVTTITDGSGSAQSVVVLSDGNIVVGGQALVGSSPGAFLLLAYNGDGSPDEAFGEPSAPGVVITPFGTTATGAAAVELQADGMLVAVGGAQAARYRWDGSLDVGGLVSLAFDPAQTRSEVTGLAVDGDGRLVAAGTVRVGDFNMALARFAADYSDGLDLTFGTDEPQSGRTMYGSEENEEVQALAVRADGKPIVAGQAYSTGPTRMLIGRFNADGMPDLQCNSVGFASISFGFGNDAARALALAPNDRTYVAGRVIGPEDFDYGIARFTNACTVDTFGNPPAEYKLALEIDGPDFPNGVVYQPATDRPVLAGISGGNIVVVRILANNDGVAELDTTFGVDGYAILDVGANESVAGIAAQSDGKLIVAGTVADNFFVTRLTADGDPDSTFGTGGITMADIGGLDGAQGLAVRADNSIAVVGSSFSAETSRTVFAVAQFTPGGLNDASFGMDGRATVEFGADGSDVAQAVTFVGSDRLVLGGFTVAAGVRRFALAALETSGVAPRQCTGDCDGDGMVFVDELLTMINIALGTTNVATCEAGDADGSGTITVDEILTAVNNALVGCPAA